MSDRDLLLLRPRIKPGVRISGALRRGTGTIHLIRDPDGERRLEVGVKEYFIIVRLDGTRSLDEIGQEYARQFRLRLGGAQWQQMLGLLYGRGLLAGHTPAAAPARSAPPPSSSPSARSASPPPVSFASPPPTPPPVRGPGRRSTLLTGSVRLVADPPALLDRLHRATGFVRRPLFLLPLAVLVLALLAGIAARLGQLVDETARLTHQPVALAAVGAVLWVSLALHELAHGLAGRAFGARTTEIGLRRWLLMTYLYCEMEDVRFLPRRRQQVATAGAGALMNLALLLPCYPVWALLPERAQARPFLAGLLLFGTVMALANLLPLPPLDGYKILGYALGHVQLATDSRTFATLLARAAVRRGKPGALAGYSGRLRLVLGGYALVCAGLAALALAATGPLCRYLLPARYAGPAGWAPLLVAGVALALWAVGLLARAARRRRGGAP
ncbi:M50 family metallopeptidase [Kitasatospora sp. NBC_01560]|uniref:peptidase M50 n=1 Tax=Kitasatospora sp. NBC_01560 TaxID=2975965 RepID=UPI003863151C